MFPHLIPNQLCWHKLGCERKTFQTDRLGKSQRVKLPSNLTDHSGRSGCDMDIRYKCNPRVALPTLPQGETEARELKTAEHQLLTI